MSDDSVNRRRLSRRILSQIRPFWPQILLLLVVDLLATPLLLLSPVPVALAVGTLIGGHPLPGFVDAFVPDSVGRSSLALLFVVAGLQVLIVLMTDLQSLVSYVLQ